MTITEHTQLINKLEVRDSEYTREITACEGRLLLARLVKVAEGDLRGVLSIDVVEKKISSREEASIGFGERRLVYESVEPPQDLTETLHRIELVYYQNPDVYELISIRAYLKREISDQELKQLYVRILEFFAPNYLEKVIKLVSKC